MKLRQLLGGTVVIRYRRFIMNSKQSQQSQQSAAIPTGQSAPVKQPVPASNDEVHQVALLGYN